MDEITVRLLFWALGACVTVIGALVTAIVTLGVAHLKSIINGCKDELMREVRSDRHMLDDLSSRMVAAEGEMSELHGKVADMEESIES